ncbi:hypothetical protein PtrV1_06457 [Pyrenophora tritici-repentis]|nr:hypothetical protein PtrV1_06457 [Pyrenophora tritici-repentis]PZD23255.1 hypothetical protein A1F96_10409 [Pyrenophora tritici-repentis]
MQTEPEQQSTEAVPDYDISDLDLEHTSDALETDSESGFEHSRYPSYCSRKSDDSDSSENGWDSDDYSGSASSYSEESDASDASDESNLSRHTDESDSRSEITGAEEASDTSDTDEYNDGVLLGDLQPQCTCQCAVHAPEMRGWSNAS